MGSCCDVSEIGECFAGVGHGADDGVGGSVAGQIAEVDDEPWFLSSVLGVEQVIDLLLSGVPGIGAGVTGGGEDRGLVA